MVVLNYHLNDNAPPKERRAMISTIPVGFTQIDLGSSGVFR
jgi:hypothetical protein